MRRSLILAGGGMKVAFQAGVLQVWLDEAGLTFDHVDGASGATFNLAMLCQGMSGSQIAANWRDLPAAQALDLNLRRPLTPVTGESLATLDRLRERVFTRWGLDWNAIRASPLEATFNVYNFTRHELEVIEPARMSEDLLVACVSLPMWFPPVQIDGQTYIDSVFITDANIEEAIARGADELWIIWTVSERSEWNPGFVGSYFGIIETAANGHFRRILRRIEAGEFGRPIEVRLLRAEVPLHYLLTLSPDRFTEAVERGVEAGRRWCAEQGIALGAAATDGAGAAARTLRFSETMRGAVTLGAHDGGANGGRPASPLAVHLTITADDLHRFMHHPEHAAAVTGEVHCEDLGGRLPIERGSFNLFVDAGDPAHKRMLYRLFFSDGVGHPLTLSGHKVIEAETGRGLWKDTTTLHTRLLAGHVEADGEAGADVIAAGVITISIRDFMRQLTTFRAHGPSRGAEIAMLVRFGRMFAGGLWDVYARRVVSSSPF